MLSPEDYPDPFTDAEKYMLMFFENSTATTFPHIECSCPDCKPTVPPGVVEARRKFEATMALVDSSRRVKVYSKTDLIGVELLSRDDELKRKNK